MSTTTPYLGLVLYDNSGDQAVTFATFRAVWGGTAASSNFYKIDTNASELNSRITALEGASGATPVAATYTSPNLYGATGVSGITSYNPGMLIILSLNTTSDGTVTLNINSLGVKSVMKVNSSGTPINLTGSDLVVGRQYLFIYDGTRWLWVSANSADQIQIVGTSGNVVTVGSTNNLVATITQAQLIADTTHAATTKTTPVDADEFSLMDSAASYVLKRITYLSLKAAIFLGIKPPEGTVYNGRILPSVTSNNLTLSLKTFSGGNPSSTDPVYVILGGSVRTVSAALSVTKNAGTNWANAGSSELATKEIDWFAYLGYNATDGVVIGFSRIPSGTRYGDFSVTSTNEKHLAVSTNTNAVTNDPYSNVGRFSATLSAGEAYTWAVPTYTPLNLVQNPIYTTRVLQWQPVYSASGSMTYTSVDTIYAQYSIQYNICNFALRSTGITGGTANTNLEGTLPFKSALAPVATIGLAGFCVDTSAIAAFAVINDGASSFVGCRKYDQSNYGLGAGRIMGIQGFYTI